ncbi:MAG: enoyl-CoA hydratase [Rhizobiales bacterium]|nr:enoyl-CoA hydratase [Hyphomicrobiales bacterium]
MIATLRWTANLVGTRSDIKPHTPQIGRPRIRAESPLWTLRRSELGRVVREPIPTQPQLDGPEPRPHFEELDLFGDPDGKTLWCYMRPKGRPSFTPSLLHELIGLRCSLQAAHATPYSDPPPRYFVGGSRLPRIYNLGGDLTYFAEKIRTQDHEGLRRYAYDCVDVGYHMWTGFELPMITIALVQGDALGGGFEGALSFNVIVAEKSAKFGLPEILVNLFPGMGAYSFISRKLDAARAERMILSGDIYSAKQLYDLGLIDILAEDGQGEAAVRDYIARNVKHHAVHRSIRAVRNRIIPLTLDELRDVADVWVEHALRLDESDLRKMERLRSAQDRRLASEKA